MTKSWEIRTAKGKAKVSAGRIRGPLSDNTTLHKLVQYGKVFILGLKAKGEKSKKKLCEEVNFCLTP